MLPGQEECGSEAEKIQNAGAVHADAEDGEDDGQDQREHEGYFHQQEDRQHQRRGEDGEVPELPEKERGFCGEVFGVVYMRVNSFEWC